VAGKTLEIVCDLLGTNPEDRFFGFDFAQFPEVQAGATVVSGAVEYRPLPVASATPAVTAPQVGTYGLTVGTPAVAQGGQQVQVEIVTSLAADGVTYAFACTATLSTGSKVVRRGRLLGTGST
jgi:hypothetical protein